MDKLKSINIKGKEYVTVNERIKYFHKTYNNGSITAHIVSHENGVVVMKAVVTPDISNAQRFFTGLAYEKEGSTFINKTSYIENCESSAVGRALGFLGIGVETSIASAEEVANAIKNQNSKSEIREPEVLKQPKNAPQAVKPPKEEPTKPKGLQARINETREILGEDSFQTILRGFEIKNLSELKNKELAERVATALENEIEINKL